MAQTPIGARAVATRDMALIDLLRVGQYGVLQGEHQQTPAIF